MLKKIRNIAIAVLAILGVVFIILMLLPDDEEGADDSEAEYVAEESMTDDGDVGSGSNAEGGNTVSVNIPASEISDKTLKFKTLTLDNKEADQNIFGDYDLTVVYIWGTYCGSCIKEMDDYAALHKDLPDNVNLMGLMVDVYDGIDSNVSDANKILDAADAEFVNIRTSDSLYDLLKQIQYIPSSVIVDREGHIIGPIMEGVSCDVTKKTLNGYLK